MAAGSKKIDSNYSTSLTIIQRVNDNITRYNDVSFDWRLKRRLNSTLSAQIAFRHWTFVEQKPVYFFWYDLIHVQQKSTFKWVNLLRFHHGLDWVGKEKADFIRWRNHYYQKIKESKLEPFIGYDLWYRFNELNYFQNLWLEAGTEYKLGNIKMRFNYRRITHFKNRPGWKRHVIVTGVFYSFD